MSNDLHSHQIVDPLDEHCPVCKAIPGHPCRDKENGNRTMGAVHERRVWRGIRRVKAKLTDDEIDALIAGSRVREGRRMAVGGQ